MRWDEELDIYDQQKPILYILQGTAFVWSFASLPIYLAYCCRVFREYSRPSIAQVVIIVEENYIGYLQAGRNFLWVQLYACLWHFTRAKQEHNFITLCVRGFVFFFSMKYHNTFHFETNSWHILEYIHSEYLCYWYMLNGLCLN